MKESGFLKQTEKEKKKKHGKKGMKNWNVVTNVVTKSWKIKDYKMTMRTKSMSETS